MGPLFGDMTAQLILENKNRSLNCWHDNCLDCLRHIVTVSKPHCNLFNTIVTWSIRLIPRCLVMKFGVFRNTFCPLGME